MEINSNYVLPEPIVKPVTQPVIKQDTEPVSKTETPVEPKPESTLVKASEGMEKDKNTIKDSSIDAERVDDTDDFAKDFLGTEPTLDEAKESLEGIKSGATDITKDLENVTDKLSDIKVPEDVFSDIAEASPDFGEKIKSFNNGIEDIQSTFGAISDTASSLAQIGNLAAGAFNSVSDLSKNFTGMANPNDLLGFLKSGTDKIFGNLKSMGVDLDWLKDFAEKGIKGVSDLGAGIEKKLPEVIDFANKSMKTISEVSDTIYKISQTVDKLSEGIDVIAELF